MDYRVNGWWNYGGPNFVNQSYLHMYYTQQNIYVMSWDIIVPEIITIYITVCVRACTCSFRYAWGLMRPNIPTQASSEVCACLACLLTSNAIKTFFFDRIFSQKDFLSDTFL